MKERVSRSLANNGRRSPGKRNMRPNTTQTLHTDKNMIPTSPKNKSIKCKKLGAHFSINVKETDPSTGKEVDYFLLCSKTNSTMQSCKTGAQLDYIYKITWDRFVNTKLYKYNKKKNSWMKIDG